MACAFPFMICRRDVGHRTRPISLQTCSQQTLVAIQLALLILSGRFGAPRFRSPARVVHKAFATWLLLPSISLHLHLQLRETEPCSILVPTLLAFFNFLNFLHCCQDGRPAPAMGTSLEVQTIFDHSDGGYWPLHRPFSLRYCGAIPSIHATRPPFYSRSSDPIVYVWITCGVCGSGGPIFPPGRMDCRQGCFAAAAVPCWFGLAARFNFHVCFCPEHRRFRDCKIASGYVCRRSLDDRPCHGPRYSWPREDGPGPWDGRDCSTPSY